MSRNCRIVVGIGGSEGGGWALRWAIPEAAARGGTVPRPSPQTHAEPAVRA